jgi:hypothetical protein
MCPPFRNQVSVLERPLGRSAFACGDARRRDGLGAFWPHQLDERVGAGNRSVAMLGQERHQKLDVALVAGGRIEDRPQISIDPPSARRELTVDPKMPGRPLLQPTLLRAAHSQANGFALQHGPDGGIGAPRDGDSLTEVLAGECRPRATGCDASST